MSIPESTTVNVIRGSALRSYPVNTEGEATATAIDHLKRLLDEGFRPAGNGDPITTRSCGIFTRLGPHGWERATITITTKPAIS